MHAAAAKTPRPQRRRRLRRALARPCLGLWLSLGCGLGAEAAAVEALLEAAGAQAVVVRDLAEEETRPSRRLFAERGFAALRPALAGDSSGQARLQRALRRGNGAAAAEQVVESPSGLLSLGFSWVSCGAPSLQHFGPTGTLHAAAEKPGSAGVAAPSRLREDFIRGQGLLAAALHVLLLHLPSAARLLKVWLPLRVPVQPLALKEGPGRDARWWWHANLTLGDAVVLDASRTPHAPFTLPGEQALARSVESARQMLEVLSRAGVDGEARLGRALEACGGLDAGVLDPEPYPVVGHRYTVDSELSAFMRQEEHVESEVQAEVRPGGIVTVLALGEESYGRVRVYTEHARSLQMDGFGDGEMMPGLMSLPEKGGTTGWISSADYHGARLLRPLATGGATPPCVKERIREIGTLLMGICGWANNTADAVSNGTARELPLRHAAQICGRHARSLAAQIEEASHAAFELQCIALVEPGRGHFQAAAAGTLAAVLSGWALLRRRGPPPRCSV